MQSTTIYRPLTGALLTKVFLFGLVATCWTVAFILAVATAANAVFVTVSLAPVANEVHNLIQNPPVGLSTLGGVPFNIPASGNNSWSSHINTTIGVRSTEAMVLPLNVYGATAIDTLINLGWGIDGFRTVTASFIGTGGANYSLDLVTGVDIRNWLECANTPFSDSINGTTTTQVFSGVPANPDYSNFEARIDKQHITLPASFATQTLTKFILVDNGISGDATNTIYDNSQAQRSFIYGITVETVPAGDYDGDGTVDGRDYVVWRSNLGYTVPPCTGGDANCNGFVEWADYGPWRENWGRTIDNAGSAVGSGHNELAAIPEPSSLVILLAAGLVMLSATERFPDTRFRSYAARQKTVHEVRRQTGI